MIATATPPMAEFNRALASPNDNEAFRHLLSAAESGCLRAQSLVGLAYHSGHGVPPDFTRAAEWYLKAASGGDSCAIANLGVMIFLGQGTDADDIEAYTWLLSAANLGHTGLQPAVDLLERRMKGDRDANGDLALVTPQTPICRPCTRGACDYSRCEAA